MTNGELDNIMLLAESGELITGEEIKELIQLKDQYKEAMTELCVKGDIDQAMFMREKMLDIKKLIDKAEQNKVSFNVETNNKDISDLER